MSNKQKTAKRQGGKGGRNIDSAPAIRNRNLGVRRVRACDLVPHELNWRAHPKTQQDALRGILTEIGFVGTLLAHELPDGRLQLIDGHLRAETLPSEEVDVMVVDLSPEEAAKVLATHDPLAAMAEANAGKLEELLRDVQTGNEALAGMLEGLAQDAGILDGLNGGEVTEDEVPDPPKEAVSRTGDLWILGEHRLLCGDSTKTEDVARVMGGERAMLLQTDAPYGVDYAAVKNGIPRSGFKDIQARGGDIENDDLTSGPELQAFLEKMILAALPHLQERTAFYFWHPMLMQGTFFAAAAAAAADILIHRQIIWVKPRMVLTRSGMYHWQHELCFYGWIRGKIPPWYGDKGQTSVWHLGESQQGREHPTQKPVALWKSPMENHTKAGEICYEPFSGSGSQLLCGEQLGRRVFAIELKDIYVDVAVERWQRLTNREAILESTGRTFAETGRERCVL